MSQLKSNDLEYYSNLVNLRSSIYEETTDALDVVKEFIIRKNLILVGGMAIDLALRLKGDSIYTEDQIPDYDFYSPNHSADAYELGSILCKMGFSNISCINALHITTMRVRVDFETVADITYCPIKIYNTIPTLNYDKLRIVHPHWQMTDQHRSLSIPFENPGREVIFHRWVKDMERYDKLYKYYPVVTKDTDIISEGITLELEDITYKPGRISGNTDISVYKVNMPLEKISGSCICGWSSIDYKLDGDNVILSIPSGEPITVASYDYKKFIKDHNLEIIEHRSEYFGKIPRRVICSTNIKDSSGRNKKLEVYDIFGILLSSRNINKKHNVYVCNLQYSMMFLLTKMFASDNDKIISMAEELYIKCRKMVTEGEYPSVEVYGNDNFTHARLNSIKMDKERIYTIKAEQLQPLRSYPKLPGCLNNKEFDPETSEYFIIDSRKTDKFIEWTTEPYPEFTKESSRN